MDGFQKHPDQCYSRRTIRTFVLAMFHSFCFRSKLNFSSFSFIYRFKEYSDAANSLFLVSVRFRTVERNRNVIQLQRTDNIADTRPAAGRTWIVMGDGRQAGARTRWKLNPSQSKLLANASKQGEEDRSARYDLTRLQYL